MIFAHKLISVSVSFIIGAILILFEQYNVVNPSTPLGSLVSVVAYSLIGTSVLFSVYNIIDFILPVDIEAEIFERKNVAAAIFKGLLLLGIAIIIAAVILAP